MILYKVDTKGKLRELSITTAHGELIQSSGLIEGVKIIHKKECTPKNVGKSNETAAEEQSLLEKEALITRKLVEGYFKTEEEAKNSEVILPMLAKEYNKEQHKIDWSKPVFIQPKLDGMRCLGNKFHMISRKNKEITTLTHIQKVLEKTDILDYLDGEVYAHGLSFQENMKLIKKYRPGQTEQVSYHLYDMVLPNLSFEQRYTLLKRIKESIDSNSFEIVPTFKICNEEGLKKFHAKFIAQGYEGSIIRHGKDGYKVNGRSSNLLKYKDFKDMDAEVIDVISSEARPLQGVLVCKGGFKANLKFSHIEREEILKNKQDYIGKIANIRYFEKTDAGLPRFPVCVGFHEDR